MLELAELRNEGYDIGGTEGRSQELGGGGGLIMGYEALRVDNMPSGIMQKGQKRSDNGAGGVKSYVLGRGCQRSSGV